MGREIRRVPPNWEHPKDREKYIPLHDGMYYKEEALNWCEEFENWKNIDNRPEKFKEYEFYFNYDPPPLQENYTCVEPTQCIWYQVYETISEGTPVSPPFGTEEELINYLVENGDFWCQKDKGGEYYSKPSRESATKFVKEDGSAPSFVIDNGMIKEGINAC